MRRYRYAIAVSLLFATVAAQSTQAAEVTLYVMQVPPLTLNSPGRYGIAGDLALAAIKRAGYDARIIVVPNNRAMAMVQGGDARDTLIIPLARLKEREPHYTWIAPVAKVNRTFFALDRSVASFDEARSAFRVIGVARGTAGVHILQEQGFAAHQIYEINDNDIAPRMLLAQRFDAWYGPTLQFREWLRDADPQHRIKASTSLGATLNYMACSKICDPVMVTRLADAVDKLTRDGTAKAIEARYSRSE
ncbi:polar amino acid transport system substrate-binding protein [Duganella sp. CF402]|uniref:substrate-binding periplasmic protein n=1 Tax=unclassified Duganella TaxID=2636909 RepID=UPI0008CD0E4C|nr:MULTISPECIES: transporter substrate-binding domain-containing protein [unclassified Duganella]RZT10220.1 amino acid ABC transporter substrate-binding protein (PAAT family) [Duganella sp. BK701]SEL22971.1 polar amino acid transport system substrate-binding protein [Duganella sp. CF402]